MATVSVIIPTYNRAQVLPAAVDSVLAQTVPPEEILIVDDGSSDETAAVCARFTAPVRYIRIDNGGAGRARNIGLAEARGEWIAFLDSDDQWIPEKLAVQLAVLAEKPQADWSISDFRLMDAGGNLLAAPGFESCFALFRDLGRDPSAVFGDALTATRHTILGRDHTVFAGDPFDLLFLGNFGLPSTALIRSSLIRRAGGFDTSFRVAGDNEFFHRIAAQGNVAIVMSPLAVWRVGRSDKLSGSSNTPELIANAYRSMEMAASLRPLNARARKYYAMSRRLLARRLAYERLSQYRPGDARRTIWKSMITERDTSPSAVALLTASLLPPAVLRLVHAGKRALGDRRRMA